MVGNSDKNWHKQIHRTAGAIFESTKYTFTISLEVGHGG
jgi:hypothetical protein